MSDLMDWETLFALDVTRDNEEVENILNSLSESLLSIAITPNLIQNLPVNATLPERWTQLSSAMQRLLQYKQSYLLDAEEEIHMLSEKVESNGQVKEEMEARIHYLEDKIRRGSTSQGNSLDNLSASENIRQKLRDAEKKIIELEALNRELQNREVDQSELWAAKDELEQTQRQNRFLQRDLETVQQALDSEKQIVQESIKENREMKFKITELQAETERLKQDIGDYQNVIEKQREQLSSQRNSESEHRLQVKEKNHEIAKYLKEINDLSTHQMSLSSEVESLTQELRETVLTLEKVTRERDELQLTMNENDTRYDVIVRERNQLRQMLDEMEANESERDKEDAEAYQGIHQQVLEWKVTLQNKTDELQRKDTVIAQLNAELDQLHVALDEYDYEGIMKGFAQRDETIAELRNQLEEAYRDFELLNINWDAIQNLTSPTSEKEQTLPSSNSYDKLNSSLSKYRELFKKERYRMQVLTESAADNEKKLIELTSQLQKYESGTFGLAEAVAESKTLKIKLAHVSKELSENVKRQNQLQRDLDEAEEENEELRNRAGIPPDEPITKRKVKKNTELEQTKAMNVRLLSEIEVLEEERLQLKSQLRLRAVEQGGRAAILGLTAEELIAVEDYAEKIKSGQIHVEKSQVQVVAAAADSYLKDELQRLHVELREQKFDKENLEAELEAIRNQNSVMKEAINELTTAFTLLREAPPREIAIVSPSTSVEKEDEKVPLAKKELGAGQMVAVQSLVNLLHSEKEERRSKWSLHEKDEATQDLLKFNQKLRQDLEETQRLLERARRECQHYRDLYETVKQMTVIQTVSNSSATGTNLSPKKATPAIEPAVTQLVAKEEELHVTSARLRQSQKESQKLQESLQLITAERDALQGTIKQTQDDLVQARNAITELEQKMIKENGLLVVECRVFRSKCLEYDQVIDTLRKNDPNAIEEKYIDASKRAAQSKATQEMLQYKLEVVQMSEQLLTRQLVQLREELQTKSHQFADQWHVAQKEKATQLKQIEQLIVQLEDSVPAKQLIQTQNELETLSKQHRQLLDQHLQSIDQDLRIKSLQQEASQLKENNEELMHSYMAANLKAEKLNKALQDVSSTQNTSQLLQKVVALELQLENSTKRMQMGETKISNLQATEKQAQSRIMELENQLLEATQALHKERETLFEARSLTSNVHPLSKQKDQEWLNLEEKLAHYKAEADKYRTLHDLMERQVQEMKNVQPSLTEPLQWAKMMDHANDAVFSIERLKQENIKMHDTLIELESVAEKRAHELTLLRQESHLRFQQLYSIVQQMRKKFAGVSSLSVQNNATAMLQQLRHLYEKSYSESKLHHRQIEVLNGQLTEAQLQVELKEDLIRFLQGDPNDLKAKTVEWHQKMTELRLENLKLSREKQALKQAVTAYEAEIQDQATRIVKLEDAQLSMQNDWDAQQVLWEQRLFELERAVHLRDEELKQQLLQGEKEENSATNSFTEMHGRLSQLNQQLLQQTQLLHRSETLCKEYARKLNDLEDALREKERRILDLEQMQAHLSVKHEEQMNQVQLSYQERQEEALQKLSHSLASAHEQLTTKEALVTKYQNMVTSSRQELLSQREADREAYEQLTKQVYEQSDHIMKRYIALQKQVQELPTNEITVSDANHDEWLEVQKIKDYEVQTLRMHVETLKREAETERAEREQEWQLLKQQLSDYEATIRAKDGQLQQLDDAWTATKEELQKLPAKRYQELYQKCKADLEKSEKERKALQNAMTKLRDELVENAKTLAEQRLGNGNEFQLEVTQFRDRLQKMTREAEKRKETVALLEQEREQLKLQLSKKESHAQTQSLQLQKQYKQLRDAQSKLKKMQDEHQERPQTAPSSSLGTDKISEALRTHITANAKADAERKWLRKTDALQSELAQCQSKHQQLLTAHQRVQDENERLDSQLQQVTRRLQEQSEMIRAMESAVARTTRTVSPVPKVWPSDIIEMKEREQALQGQVQSLEKLLQEKENILVQLQQDMKVKELLQKQLQEQLKDAQETIKDLNDTYQDAPRYDASAEANTIESLHIRLTESEQQRHVLEQEQAQLVSKIAFLEHRLSVLSDESHAVQVEKRLAQITFERDQLLEQKSMMPSRSASPSSDNVWHTKYQHLQHSYQQLKRENATLQQELEKQQKNGERRERAPSPTHPKTAFIQEQTQKVARENAHLRRRLSMTQQALSQSQQSLAFASNESLNANEKAVQSEKIKTLEQSVQSLLNQVNELTQEKSELERAREQDVRRWQTEREAYDSRARKYAQELSITQDDKSMQQLREENRILKEKLKVVATPAFFDELQQLKQAATERDNLRQVLQQHKIDYT